MKEFPIIEEELCIGCGACVAVCINDVIELDHNEKAKIVNPDVCSGTEDCAKICPTEAITLPWIALD